MGISNNLVSQFAKLTNNTNKQKEETVYGTIVSQGDKLYVVLDGSNTITPIVTTAEIQSGERVAVMIKDHTATVIGNITNPGVSQSTTNGMLGEFDVVKARIGEFELLIADRITTEQLEAKLAIIQEAIIDKATIEDLRAVKALIDDLDVGELEAQMATLHEAVIGKADITDLTAIRADIESLEVGVAEIETLIGGHLTMDNIQSLVLTSSKVTVDNAFIKDAMIDRVSASKLTAGRINTSFIQLSSEDESLLINGSTQQFKDANGNVRIQIGKDETGDFTFALYGEDGKGQLINQNGITASAVEDGLIVDKMVSDNANISGGKLDIDSVIFEINENDSSIKSSRILLDESNQSLDVAFKTLKNTVENIKEVAEGDFSGIYSRIESLETDVNITQGEIDTLISNTVIENANGQTVLMKDDYSATKQTVNQISTKIGSLETTTSDVSSKQSALEQDLSGFKISVSDTYSTKDQVASAINGIEIGTSNYFRYSNFDRVDVLDNWYLSNSAFHNQKIAVYANMGKSLDSDKHIKGRNVYCSSVDLSKATTTYVSFYPWANSGRYYMTLEANTTYTFSYWVYLGGNTSHTHATVYCKNDTDGNTTLARTETIETYTGGFEKRSVTFTTTNFNEIHITFYHYPKEGLTTGRSEIYIYQPMLVKGSKDTNWTENPEDIEKYGVEYTDSQVSRAEADIKITTDAISQSVSSLTSTVSKKADSTTVSNLSSKVTTIETNLSGVTTRVSNTEQEIQKVGEKALKNYNNLLVNSNIKNGTQGWRLTNLVLNNSLYNAVTSATAPPDRHALMLGSPADNTAQTRYMDSTKFAVTAGEKISISYYIMANEYVTYARVYILFTDNTKPITEDNTFFDGYTFTGVSGYTAWTKKTETVTVPQGATRAFIRIRYQSAEKASTSDLNRASLTSIMVSRGEDYPTWTCNAEDVYYAHEDRIKYAEQKITDDAIINTVSSTYYKKTEVDKAIDGIEVGGENLLSFTDFSTNKYLTKWRAYSNTSGAGTLVHVIEPAYDIGCFRVYSPTMEADTPVGIYHSEYIKLIGGQKYTLSFSAKSGGWTSDLDYIYILNYDEGGANQKLSKVTIHANDSDLDKVTSSITFTPNVTIEKARILIACADATVTTNNKGFYIKNIKLEKGNKATYWCPSPKDTDYELNAANNKITDLTTRVSTAESKITDDAITNVVKQNFYTKSETDGQITSKGYQTQSQVQQTVDKLELKFQQSGGYNLLYNGDFRRGYTNWSSTSGFTTSIGNGNYSSRDRRGICIVGQSGTSGYIHQDISSEYFSALNFTLSGYVYIDGTGVDDPGYTYGHYYARLAYSDGTYTYHRCNWDKTAYGKWHYTSLSFSRDTTKTLTAIRVILCVQYTTRRLYLSQAMLEIGTTATAWSPNPNEIHDGVVTIDKDGVNVRNSKANTTTSMTADGFYINQTGHGDVFKVDSDGINIAQHLVLLNKNGLTVNSPTNNVMTYLDAKGLNVTQNGISAIRVHDNGLEIAQGIVKLNKNGLTIDSPNYSVNTYIDANGLNVMQNGLSALKVHANGLEIAQGIVTIDKNKVRVSHSDGSYSQMTSAGFMRYISGANKYYHYLMSTGTVNVRDGVDATVTLPSEFQGKNFQVTLSAFKVNIIPGWKGIYDIDSLVRSYDRANGKFTIGGMVNDVSGLEGTLDVSYIVIA